MTEATESVDNVPAMPGHSGLDAKFEDFDDAHVYAKTKRLVVSEDTANFVVEFKHDSVRIAFNLDHSDMGTLLKRPTPEGTVRWINIWTPAAQRHLIKVLGGHYGFTRRLQAILAMPPPRISHKKDLPTSRPSTARGSVLTSRSQDSNEPASDDIELGSGVTLEPSQDPSATSKDVEIYRLVKDTLGFTSVDYGEQFVCIGTNWLHGREEGEPQLLQPKHWSWFTLCSDHTVISLHDTPVFENPNKPDLRRRELASMRSNTTSILCQLSHHGFKEYEDKVLSLKSIRELLSPERGRGGVVGIATSDNEDGPRSDAQTEGSSNLFYYLFEDYGGSVPVLEASKRMIADLTERVLCSSDRRSRAKTKDIPTSLYALRSELRQLQNLFESYRKIIHRITRPRHVSNGKDSHSAPIKLSGNVKLSELARNRFERLEDRLQMLMLNTINEGLQEQKALSQTYFNLMAQKDSQATARLTRSATLLAKLSVFFLPINFMTSYFGVEIDGFVDGYTSKTYWVSFAVLAGLSFIALFFFGRLLELFSEKADNWSERWFRRRRHDDD